MLQHFNFPVLLSSGLLLQMPVVQMAILGGITSLTGLTITGLAASLGIPLIGMLASSLLMQQLRKRLPGGAIFTGLAVAGLFASFFPPMIVLIASFSTIAFENLNSKSLRILGNGITLALAALNPWFGIGAWLSTQGVLLTTALLAHWGFEVTALQVAGVTGLLALGPLAVRLCQTIAPYLNLPVMIATVAILQAHGYFAMCIAAMTQATGIALAGMILGGVIAPFGAMTISGWLMQQILELCQAFPHPYFKQTAQNLLTGLTVGFGLLTFCSPLTALGYGLGAMSIQNILPEQLASPLRTTALLTTLLVYPLSFAGWAVRGASVLYGALTTAVATHAATVPAARLVAAGALTASGTTVFNYQESSSDAAPHKRPKK